MSVTVNKILQIARNEIGTKATNYKKCKYNTWYYGSAVSGNQYDWCEVFIQWVFYKAGASSMLYTKTANCGAAGKAFYDKGKLVTSGYKVGDIVFFHWSNDKSSYVPSVYTMDHVGIIESINSDGTITTIEGNNIANIENGEVRRQVRSMSVVSCAGRPAYASSDSSSDPSDTGLALKTGRKLVLSNVALYVSSSDKTKAATKTGTYYIWSSDTVNNRIRITNSAANVGNSAQVTGWITVADAKKSAAVVTLSSGMKLSLTNTPLYVSSESGIKATTITGVYYIWNTSVINNRIRITNNKQNVGKSEQITGWISVNDAKNSV